MRHLLIILFFSVNYLPGNANITPINKTGVFNLISPVENVQSDTVLINIQDKIYRAFVKDRISQKDEALNAVSIQLENLYKAKKQNLILYWRSYLTFYSSIAYLIKGDNKSAEDEINKGIEMLEMFGKKSSEDYALLARLQSFGIQFNPMKAMYISQEIKKNVNSSISLDSTNLRAYYVYASYDFHIPEEYGGGKETEKYSLKAIALPVQKIINSYLPSWGKEESYELLISFYIKKEKWDLARKYLNEGIVAFPESYVIKQLSPKLTGK
jgi:hypothetical protein